MILKILELENFGPFQKEIFNFNELNNLVSGDNGSGKSHIIDAIILLLYNQTRTSLKSFISWGKDTSKVKLEGTISGIDFMSSIKITDKDTERLLTFSNESEPYCNSDAVKKLNEVLDSKIALNSSVVKQGENDLILLRPAERRELLKKIYNLNYQNVIKELETEIKQDKEKNLKKLDNEIYLLQNKDYFLEKITDFDENNYNQLKVNYDFKEKNYYDKLKIKESFTSIQKELEELTIKKGKFNIDNNIIEKNKTIIQINELSRNPGQLDNNLEKYEKELQELKVNHVQEIEKYVHEGNSLVIIRLKVFNYEELDTIKTQIIKLENDIFIEKDNLKKLENGICPTCDSTNINSNMFIKKEKLKTYEIELDNLKIQKENLEKEKIEYENKQTEQEKIKNSKKEILQKTEYAKKQYEIEKKSYEEKLIMEGESIKNKINNLKEKILNLENNLKKLELTIKQEREEKSVIENRINEVNKLIKNQEIVNLEILKKELNESKETIQKIERIKIINEENIIKNKEIGQQKKLDGKSISSLLENKNKLNDKIQESERCRIIFQKEFPNFIIQELIIDIENKINEFLEETYEGLYQLKIKEKKDAIYLLYGPDQVDVLNASKYEQTIFSNAYKYALWKILNDKKEFNYPLLLDEADNFASEKNSHVFYKYLLENVTSQSIIITHTSSAKNFILSHSDCKLFELTKGAINE